MAASLILLISPLCRDGMADVLPTVAAGGAIATPSTKPDLYHQCTAGMSEQMPCHMLTTASTTSLHSDGPQPHEMMVACLAFLVAVLAALRAVHPPPRPLVDTPRRPHATLQPPEWPARALTRAQLCVLRA